MTIECASKISLIAINQKTRNRIIVVGLNKAREEKDFRAYFGLKFALIGKADHRPLLALIVCNATIVVVSNTLMNNSNSSSSKAPLLHRVFLVLRVMIVLIVSVRTVGFDAFVIRSCLLR